MWCTLCHIIKAWKKEYPIVRTPSSVCLRVFTPAMRCGYLRYLYRAKKPKQHLLVSLFRWDPILVQMVSEQLRPMPYMDWGTLQYGSIGADHDLLVVHVIRFKWIWTLSLLKIIDKPILGVSLIPNQLCTRKNLGTYAGQRNPKNTFRSTFLGEILGCCTHLALLVSI